MNKGYFFMCCALLATVPSLAQPDSTVLPLDEVVVTANRFPQKQQTTGKVVTVINRETIERSGGMSLTELLNRQAGMTIVGANNNAGTNQDIYMRGAATGNTLILIDGVPMYDVSTIANTFDLNHVPLENIERIEILKGAQSTVYGSDAVAGVIHIITRKQAERPVSGYSSLTAGSFRTLRALAGLQGKKGVSNYQLQYQHNRSGGFSSAYDSTGKQGFDRDGFRQQVLSGRFGTRIAKGLEWSANGHWGRYKTDLDGSAFRDEKDFTADNRQLMAGTGLTYQRGGLSLFANYQYNRLQRNYLDDSTHVGGFATFVQDDYTGRSHFAEVYGKYRVHKQVDIIAGMDHRWQSTDQRYLSISSWGPYSTTLSADTARVGLFSAYASAVLNDGRGGHLEFGGRLNHLSRFGKHATFTLNPSYSLNDRWKFFFNLSSAFKAPSLYQLYDGSVGEKLLRPEKSLTAEGGAAFTSRARDWQSRIVLFAREIRDGIDFSYADYRYFNNNRQRDRGLEYELSYHHRHWQVQFNYTYVTGQVNTTKYSYDPGSFSYLPAGDTTYNNLFRRPRHSLNLSVSWQMTDRLQLSLSGRVIGRRYEPRFMAAPIALDPYQTIDLSAAYRLNKRWKVFVDLRNLTNARYFDIVGFGARPLHVMGGLTFRW